ncbi:MAG: hypothetical protein AB7V32_06280 [Candidatus Berkiella sp.]
MESTKRDLRIIIGFIVLILLVLYGFSKPYLETNKYLRTAKEGYVYIKKDRSPFLVDSPYQMIYLSKISDKKVAYYEYSVEFPSVDKIKAIWQGNAWAKEGFDFKTWNGPYEISRWRFDHLDLVTRLKPAPELLEPAHGHT